jgi:hypothetical protein
MIKCLFLLYRAPAMSVEAFQSYWLNEHSKFAVASATKMRIQRYVQVHRRTHDVAEGFRNARGCLSGDFDGVAEAWWNSFEDMIAAAGDVPEEMAAAVLKDEAQFVDLKRSIIWFGEEYQLWPPSALDSR